MKHIMQGALLCTALLIPPLAFTLTNQSYAQSAASSGTAVKVGDANLTGNASAGEALYLRGCLACHNTNGQSFLGQYPRLAHQVASYTANQLVDFRTGKRQSGIMSPIALPLADQDIADLAAFLNSAPAADPWESQDATLSAQGKTLYQRCAGCHGDQAQGNPQAGFPRLAGQNQPYIQSRLKALAQDPNGGPMTQIAKGLQEADIAALSEYLKTMQ